MVWLFVAIILCVETVRFFWVKGIIDERADLQREVNMHQSGRTYDLGFTRGLAAHPYSISVEHIDAMKELGISPETIRACERRNDRLRAGR